MLVGTHTVLVVLLTPTPVAELKPLLLLKLLLRLSTVFALVTLYTSRFSAVRVLPNRRILPTLRSSWFCRSSTMSPDLTNEISLLGAFVTARFGIRVVP